MTQNAAFTRTIDGPVTTQPDLCTHKQKQTGWPAIAILALLFAGVFVGGCIISGLSVEQFYREWALLTWVGGAFIAFCIVAELCRLKCPHCRSRAVALITAVEVDRWIGQKIVDEDTISVGGFQTFGGSTFRGVAGSVAVTRRTIPVTKRCVLEKYRCETCGREFERKVVEEMR